MSIFNNRKGVALIVVIVMIIMLMVIAAVILNLAYNFRRLVYGVSTQRTASYYFSQAGIVDAEYKLRNDLGTGGPYSTNPLYTTAPYSIDVDGDGVNDVTVSIGAADVNGTRQINATSLH